VRTTPPAKLDRENLELRSQLSNLQGLLMLAMLMTESGDEEQILRLATSSVGGLAHCRPEEVYLTGEGWPWTAASYQQETARRAIERQLAGLGPLGGAVEVPDRPWGWAYPLRSLAGGVGFLVVSAEEAPTPAEQFLLRVMAQQAGMALANARLHAQEHATAEGLADKQAALRRVATLVARGVPAAAIFAAVAEEAGRLLGADLAHTFRYEPDDTVSVVAAWSRHGDDHLVVGSRYPLHPSMVTALVLRTGRPVRMDSYPPSSPLAALARQLGVRSTVGCPIMVEGRLWGLIGVSSARPEPLPADTEARLADFAELVATAIANIQAREELRTLADEQAALRRVATLVAEAAPPPVVFAAVAEEVGRLLPADYTIMARYEADDTVTVVAAWSATGKVLPVGLRRPLADASVSRRVRETGRPARFDHYEGATAAELALGIRSAVGAPITVEGRLWGLVTAASTGEEPPPPGTEQRLAAFTELVATAIANAEAQAALTASRARIVATADQTRRRIERDLHDGAQQHPVALGLHLRAAQAAVPPELEELAAKLDHLTAGLSGALEELRELSRGIHPAILAEGGLGPALKTLARRSAIPVQLHLGIQSRLPERIEVTAYYVVAEALTNAAKHAGASVVQVDVDADAGLVRLGVRDDGVGGADPARGSGLVGLKDRVEATGGTLRVDSRPAQGTCLLVELPIDAGQPPDSTYPYGDQHQRPAGRSVRPPILPHLG
jgi:signal transduction histidine kinase